MDKTRDEKIDAGARFLHEATDIGTKLTAAEKRLMADLLGFGPEWVGQKDVVANRLIERGLIRGSIPRGRQINIDLTQAGRSLLRSLQEKSNG